MVYKLLSAFAISAIGAISLQYSKFIKYNQVGSNAYTKEVTVAKYNPDLFYGSSEARRVLGNISANELQSYVDRGIIGRYPPPGKIRGKYLKAEVNALAEQIRRFNAGEVKRR